MPYGIVTILASEQIRTKLRMITVAFPREFPACIRIFATVLPQNESAQPQKDPSCIALERLDQSQKIGDNFASDLQSTLCYPQTDNSLNKKNKFTN